MIYDVAVKPEHRDRVALADFLLNAEAAESQPRDPQELYAVLRAAITRGG